MFEIRKELLEQACKADSKEEAVEILQRGGINLTDEDLKNIAGGEEYEGICWTHKVPCGWLCVTNEPDKCVSYCPCDNLCGLIM